MIQLITPTEHEKAEWSRLAQAAYAQNINSIGHRYSVAASLCRNCGIPLKTFDALQSGYRQWLIGGFATSAAAFINQHVS